MTQKFTAEEVRAVNPAQAQPLPCPFCGSKASRHKGEKEGSRWEYYCPNGHTSYLRMKEWNMRTAYADTLSKPADSGRVDAKAVERAVMADSDRPCLYGVAGPCQHPNCLESHFDTLRAALVAQGQVAVAAGQQELLEDLERVIQAHAGMKAGDEGAPAMTIRVCRQAIKALAAQGQGDRLPAELDAWLQERGLVPDLGEDGSFDMSDLIVALNDHENALMASRPAPPASPAGVPDGLLEHLREALRRVENGHSPRRIPANPGDVDLALSEAIAWLEGRPAPFWVKPAARPVRARG